MWAADSGVMWAAIGLRCRPHFLFHRNRGPHGVIVAHIEWNGGPDAAQSWPRSNGNSWSGRERASLVIPIFLKSKENVLPEKRLPMRQLREVLRLYFETDRLDVQGKQEHSPALSRTAKSFGAELAFTVRPG